MAEQVRTAAQVSVKKSRRLISAGIFTAIYFLVFLIIGSVCMPIPILYILMPVFIALVAGPVYMMLIAKTQMPGVLFIAAMLPGLFLVAMGNIWIVLLTCAVAGIVAELIARAGKYQSFALNTASFAVFAQNILGGFLPIWIMRDYFFAHTLEQGMSQEFCDTLAAVTPPWVLVAMIVATVLAAIVGSLLSRALFKKHFERAGIL